MSVTHPRPPRDPELAAVFTQLPEAMRASLLPDGIDIARSLLPPTDLDVALRHRGLAFTDHSVRAHDGAEIVVSVIHRVGAEERTRPAVFYTHGGGMISGDRWSGIDMVADIVLEHDVVGVTVDYRYAPEFPDPFPVEDCVSAWTWFSEHATSWGVDPERVMIMGSSAGGGIAAGTTLLLRARSHVLPFAQLLICPMLDDRDITVSSQQIDGGGMWDRESNRTGWGALLGDRRGGPDVSVFAAPARLEDFSGLPQAFIDAGSVEVFRDEAVAYANGLWAAGVNTELHIWAGGFHGFDAYAPHAAVAQAALAARASWVERMFRA